MWARGSAELVAARQRAHEVELLALLVGVDGRALVVRHQLLQRRELALADAVQAALHVHAEVLVAARRLQRHGEVAHVGLGVADEEVAVVAVLVEQRVAVRARDGAVVPRAPRRARAARRAALAAGGQAQACVQ